MRKGGFWEHLILVVLLMVLNSIGGPAILVTLPFSVVVTMAAYYVADGRSAQLEQA